MYFAQRLNAVTPVRLVPAAPRSRVKHSTVAYTIVSIYMLYHLTARMVLAFKPVIKAFKLLTGAIYFKVQHTIVLRSGGVRVPCYALC